jgi:transcriptional regulator with XRE-family HTH domain
VDERGIYRSFGRTVAQRRRAISKTQEQVAREIGLSRASLANIERGSQKVFLHQIIALTQALELESVHEIVPSKPPVHVASTPERIRTSGARNLSKNQRDLVSSLVDTLTRSRDRK